MPPASVAHSRAGSKTVSRFDEREFLIELPRVIAVADFAIGPAEGRVPLQVHGTDSIAIERVGDADLIEKRSELARLVAAHCGIAQKSEADTVLRIGAQRPGMVRHRERGLVLV